MGHSWWCNRRKNSWEKNGWQRWNVLNTFFMICLRYVLACWTSVIWTWCSLSLSLSLSLSPSHGSKGSAVYSLIKFTPKYVHSVKIHKKKERNWIEYRSFCGNSDSFSCGYSVEWSGRKPYICSSCFFFFAALLAVTDSICHKHNVKGIHLSCSSFPPFILTRGGEGTDAQDGGTTDSVTDAPEEEVEPGICVLGGVLLDFWNSSLKLRFLKFPDSEARHWQSLDLDIEFKLKRRLMCMLRIRWYVIFEFN